MELTSAGVSAVTELVVGAEMPCWSEVAEVREGCSCRLNVALMEVVRFDVAVSSGRDTTWDTHYYLDLLSESMSRTTPPKEQDDVATEMRDRVRRE